MSWTDTARGVKHEVQRDRLGMVSAGVAFYAFLAVFPALAAVISVWGLFADPAQVQQQIASLQGVLPRSALDLVEAAATRVAATSATSLGWGVVISMALTLWSANRGMKGLLEAIDIAYGERDERGFVKRNAVSLGFTLGAVVVTVLAIALVVALPAALGAIGLGAATAWAIGLARWPILAAIVIAALSAVYRAGTHRRARSWHGITAGAVVATALWLAVSVLFSLYVENFGSYNETYGSVAAVAILLMWFFISAFTILLGAELDAVRSTRQRTAPEPEAVRTEPAAEQPTMH